MSQAKYPSEVYRALKSRGHSNRVIAEMLGVSEAAVRRGLKPSKYRSRNAGLDPWPSRRPNTVLVQDTPDGTYVVDAWHGTRLLRLPHGWGRAAEVGKKFLALKELL